MSTQTEPAQEAPTTPSLKPQSSLLAEQEQGTVRTSEVPTLALPEPPKVGEALKTLEVGGTAVKLDHLGPMIVNKDGTLSRISNWEEMSNIERETTVRLLNKRNMLRLQNLKENTPQS